MKNQVAGFIEWVRYPTAATTKAVASHLDVDVDGVLGVVADHCPHVVEEENKLVVPLQGRLEKVSLVQCC